MNSTPDFTPGRACAEALDAADPLAAMRDEFFIPRNAEGEEKVYLVGNSLGLPPFGAKKYVNIELDRWADLGVEGHFTGELAWEPYHELLTEQLGRIVGGGPDEVVAMNSLTINLHMLMISFYEPTPARHKILVEDHAFPSDHFAAESQIRQRGFDPATSLVTIEPSLGEETLDADAIISAIRMHGDELALVLLPGVQYYTGQVFPMAEIAAAAHEVGARVGLDLAHAVGNVPLHLHDWGVDFAAWCSYKYLNGGPGGVAGAFVHRDHVTNPDLPKLLGWWGVNKETRFDMSTEFDPIPTVESWQVSNGPILSMATLRASLDVFDRAGGMGPLRAKSERQVQYLDYLLDLTLAGWVDSITPRNPSERGCQLALQITAPHREGRDVYEALVAAGVSCDWRYPDVIRIAPVPLYNSYLDIFRFVEILEGLLS